MRAWEEHGWELDGEHPIHHHHDESAVEKERTGVST